jgi:peptidyl-prolyl cis-trans isomerase SurA
MRLAPIAAVCVAAACQSRQPAPPAAPQAISPDTWAVVDGRAITRDDVEKAYRRTQAVGQTVSPEEALTVRLNILEDLVVQDLLLAKGRELKVEVPATDLDKAYADARQNISDEAFQQELTQRSLTAADMREGLRRELLAQRVLDHEVASKVTVTDQEVSDFFTANRAQFNLPEDAYRVAQIVITPVREPQLGNRTGDDATTPEAAAAKVRMLMERLKGGARFGDLARDYSEDPVTAPRGGDLGLLPLSRLKQAPQALRDAVVKASPGSVNVVSAGGAHTLVLLIGQEKAGQRDLSTAGVRENITANLRSRKEDLLRAAYLTSLRTDAKVVNYLARRVVESQGKVPLPAGPALTK